MPETVRYKNTKGQDVEIDRREPTPEGDKAWRDALFGQAEENRVLRRRVSTLAAICVVLSATLILFGYVHSRGLLTIWRYERETMKARWLVVPRYANSAVPRYAAATLPKAEFRGRLAIVTDAANADDCYRGGGSLSLLCLDTGSYWEPIWYEGRSR
ncbi:MAG TPA: hypothetical protein VGR97_15310 [Candidatus Acidoferrales bacterium]|nr:hypothetical protein [Candidatus Acidoferrales bacterium]